jgi:hypothetical protein
METNIYNLMDIEGHDIQSPSNGGQRAVEYALTTIELVLVARFLLQLFGMSHTGLVTGFVYQSSEYVLLPFSWLFATFGNGLINWAIVIAIPVYWFLGSRMSELFGRRSTFSRIEAARALSKKKYGRYSNHGYTTFRN